MYKQWEWYKSSFYISLKFSSNNIRKIPNWIKPYQKAYTLQRCLNSYLVQSEDIPSCRLPKLPAHEADGCWNHSMKLPLWEENLQSHACLTIHSKWPRQEYVMYICILLLPRGPYLQLFTSVSWNLAM